MKPLLNIEEYTSESLPHEPVITIKTWQERFDEMSEMNEFYGLPYNDLVDSSIKQFISDIIDQTREETIRAIPEEMKHNPETDSEESKTWIAGFNNCRNQLLNKLKK